MAGKGRRGVSVGARDRKTKDPGASSWFGGIDLPRAALVYGALALLYYIPAFLPGNHVYGSDYLAASYFYHEWISELFGRGEIPKWLPYVYGGLPWFANPGMTWYPFRFLADWLLPATRIFPAIYVIQGTIAGVGTYLLARELGARPWVALLTGLAFQFTGQLMSFTLAGHDGRMIGMSLGPLFLFFLGRGVRTGHAGWFAGASATIALAMLSFQIQTAYYVLLAGGLWSLFLLVDGGWYRSAQPLLRRVSLGVCAVVIAFAMNAVNFLPFLEYVDASPRAGGRGYEYAVAYSMAPSHVLALAVPEQAGIGAAYGERYSRLAQAGVDVTGENPFKLHTEYVGAFLLAMVLLGLLYARRDRRWWFFLALAAFSFTIAFGGNTPIYRLYYALLPGTSMWRTPDMGYILVPMALAAMAALTLERVAALRDRRLAGDATRSPDDETAPDFSTAVVVAAALPVLAVIGAILLGSQTTAAENAPVGWLRFALFAALTWVLLWRWLAGGLRTWLFAAGLGIVIVVDLWIVDRQFFETVPPPHVTFAPDDVADFLRSRDEPSRAWVLSFAGVPAYRGHSNYLMRFGVEQASGEHGNQLQTWNEYLGAGTEVYVDYHNFVADLQRAVNEGRPTTYIGAANIRYVVAMAQLPVPGWRLVHEGPGALIYENPAATPRAWLVARATVVPEPEGALTAMQDPEWRPLEEAFLYEAPPAAPGTGDLHGEARVLEHEHDRVRVAVETSRPALLVLADNFYPGWRARIAGEEHTVLRVNHTLRGVVVPAGRSEVEFLFRPARLYVGLALYLLCLGGFLAYAGLLGVRHWRADGSTRGGQPPSDAPAPAGSRRRRARE